MMLKKIIFCLLIFQLIFSWDIEVETPLWAAPVLGDINGDSLIEIVIGKCALYPNGTFIYKEVGCGYKNISSILADIDMDNIKEVFYEKKLFDPCCVNELVTVTTAYTSATAFDIDRDLTPDIIIPIRKESWNETTYSLVKLSKNYTKELVTKKIRTPLVHVGIANIDDDHGFELITMSRDTLFVFNSSGGLLAEKKFTRVRTNTQFPILVDLDKDGTIEIIVPTTTGLHVEVFDGTTLNSVWNLAVNISTPLSAGDITLNGYPEIVFGTKEGYISVVNRTGQIVWKLLLEKGEVPLKIYGAPIIGDFDGDAIPEVLVGAVSQIPEYNGSIVYSIRNTGVVAWTYGVQGRIIASLAMWDINEDNNNELIITTISSFFGEVQGEIHLLRGGKFNVSTMFWPMHRRDFFGTGNLEFSWLGEYCNNDFDCIEGYCENNICVPKKSAGERGLEGRMCGSGKSNGTHCYECLDDNECYFERYCAKLKCWPKKGFDLPCTRDQECMGDLSCVNVSGQLLCKECDVNATCKDDEFCTQNYKCERLWCAETPIKDCKKYRIRDHKCIIEATYPDCCRNNDDCMEDEACIKDVDKNYPMCKKLNCDDGIKCTRDFIQNHTCINEIISEDCCERNDDCMWNQYCLIGEGNETGVCTNITCESTDPCINASIINHRCEFIAITGCCRDNNDCAITEICKENICVELVCPQKECYSVQIAEHQCNYRIICICGNNLCDKNETMENCPQDCGECRENTDCGGKKRFCVDYTCVECTKDAHCADQDACTRDYCENFICKYEDLCVCGNNVCDKGETPSNCPEDCKTRCESDFECKSGVCDKDLGVCVDCTEDFHCKIGDPCLEGSCINKMCKYIPVCICGNNICDANETIENCPADCKECTTDANCKGIEMFCAPKRKICVPCYKDAHCDDRKPETVDSCVNYKCVYKIRKKEDGTSCTHNYECKSGNCNNEICCKKGMRCCKKSKDCYQNEMCLNYYCIPLEKSEPELKDLFENCTSDKECRSGRCNNFICCINNTNITCCLKNNDCPVGYYCSVSRYCKRIKKVGGSGIPLQVIVLGILLLVVTILIGIKKWYDRRLEGTEEPTGEGFDEEYEEEEYEGEYEEEG